MVKRLFKLFQLLPRKIAQLFLLSVLIGFFWFVVETGFVYILQSFLISIGLVEAKKVIIPSWFPNGIVASLILLLCYGFFRGLLFALKTFISGKTQQAYLSYQRKFIITVSFNYLERLKAHEVLSLFGEKAQNASQILLASSLIINNLVSTALFFAFGMYLAPQEFFISLLLSAIFVSPLFLMTKHVRKSGRAITDLWSNINDYMFRGITNYFFLKIYNLNRTEVNSLNQRIEDYEKNYLVYLFFAAFKKSYPIIAGIFIICFVTYLSKKYFTTAEANLVGFFYIFLRFSQTLSELGGYYSEFNVYLPAFKDMIDWNKKYSEEFAAASDYDVINTNKTDFSSLTSCKLELRDLSFGYQNSKKLFNDLNITVNPGQLLLIKGTSGAGKSTLILLILGLLKPDRGSILLNSVDVSTLNSNFLNQVGYVGPEPFIIPGSIRENLLFGNSHFNPSDSDYWSALKKAEIDDLVRTLSMKLDENLYQVAQISTGQKQRLSLARAFLRQPKLLILDEATANLDPITEKQIVATLANLKTTTTIIVISHKNSFDNIADIKLNL